MSRDAAFVSPQAHIPASCTLPAIRRGFRVTLSFDVGALACGATFGALATSGDMSAIASLPMSIFVYSGTAQMLALDLIDSNAGVLVIWGGTLLVSLRYVLLGFTMRGWFPGWPRRLVFSALYLNADQSWALMLGERDSGRQDTGFFLGSNLALFIGWTGGTAIGALAGNHLGGPTAWCLHFAASAAFIGILAGMHRGRIDVLPWLTSVAVAIGTERFIGGHWHVIAGVVAGIAVGMLQRNAA